MCLYKSKSHLPSQLNKDLKNSHVLTTESLRNEGRGFYLVWSRIGNIYPCAAWRGPSRGQPPRSRPARSWWCPRWPRPRCRSPCPPRPRPRLRPWAPGCLAARHRSPSHKVYYYLFLSHAFLGKSSPRAHSLLHFTVAFWKSNIFSVLTADWRVIILFTSRCVAPKSCSQFSHLLEIFYFFAFSLDVWNKINDVDTNWILTPNIKMFLSHDKQCTMNVFTATAQVTPRRWKQSVEWGQAVIIFLLRCSVNSLKFLALTCSLILTRLQTKLQ